MPPCAVGTPWWITIKEKAIEFGTPNENAGRVSVEQFFAMNPRKKSWAKKFRGRSPGGPAAQGGTLSDQRNNWGSVGGSSGSQGDVYQSSVSDAEIRTAYQ